MFFYKRSNLLQSLKLDFKITTIKKRFKMLVRLFYLLLILGLLKDFNIEGKEPLSIFYHRPPEEIFQRYWTNFIHETFDCQTIIDPIFKNLNDCSVVVIEGLDFKGLGKMHLMKHLENKNILIIQVGDEKYRGDWKLYEKSFCTFREYFSNKPDPNHKVFFLPIVCKYDFVTEIPYESLPKIAERDFTWSFVGQVNKSNRQKMYALLINLNLPHYDHFNSNFDSKDCLSTAEYQEILKRSLFAPCPMGWTNDESYRLYESIECGCIPIVEKGKSNYFENYFGKVPFIVLDDWEDLEKTIFPLLQDKAKLEKMRQECFLWWQTLKRKKKEELKTKIDALLELKNL